MILNKPVSLDNPSENSRERIVNKSDILIMNNRHSRYLSNTRQEMKEYFERSHILPQPMDFSRRSAINFSTDFVLKTKDKEQLNPDKKVIHYLNNTILDYDQYNESQDIFLCQTLVDQDQ